jgi:Sulfotransferase family
MSDQRHHLSTIRDSLESRVGFVRREIRQRTLIAAGRTIAAITGPGQLPERPVFVLGCPRSGTTLLFELLRRHEALRSLAEEGHVLWNAYQHPRLKGWSSDRATASDIQPGEQRYIHSAVRRIAGAHRFLDKTPKNVLRIPYLASLFPNGVIVLLHRDGRSTVSSLIEGWIARRGLSYRLPEPLQLAEYHGRYWSYVLPPGWRGWRSSSIAEVAAAQYVQSNEVALADIQSLSADSVIQIAYEALIARPEHESRRLLDRLELPQSEAVRSFAANLGARLAGSISPPRPEKWRDRIDQIDRVRPLLVPTMARLGYTWEGVG